MQARQLAVSGESVYILGLDDQLRFIVRAEEGLWGPWQETGVSGKAIVHAGAVIGRLDPDGRVSALQRVPALPWHEWEGPADEITATNLSHGAPALFAVTAGELRYTWKPTPAGPWTDWEGLGGPVTGVASTLIPGGGLVAFGITDGEVRHRWQDRPSDAWREWTALGAPGGGVRALRATSIEGGGLVVFALGQDDALYHRWQDKPFRPWQAWEEIGGDVTAFDWLFANTDAKHVKIELDIGWVQVAQQDPIALLNKYKDRVIALHVKDVGKRTSDKDPPSVALGEGVIDWKAVIGTAKKNGTKAFFYEQEEPFTRPILDSVKISGTYLTNLKI